MQKDKHTGGPSQAYPPRQVYYQQQPDNGRRFSRGEGPFVGPGGPNAMRAMHQPPQQPPTPPAPGQLPPQQQPTGMTFQVRAQGVGYRGSSPAPPRMQQHRPQGPFIHPSQMQQLQYPMQMLPVQAVPYQTPQSQFPFTQMVMPAGFFPAGHPPGTQLLYRPPFQPRQNQGHVPSPQPGGPAQSIHVMSQPPSQPVEKKRSHALKIIDPDSGADVIENFLNEERPKGQSGDPSNQETLQKQGEVVADFARQVASRLSDDYQQPPSRGSSYSESEQQSEADAAIAPSSGIPSPKIEGGNEVLGGPAEAPPAVETSIRYPEIPMQAWPQPIQVPSDPYMTVPLMVIPDGAAGPRDFANPHMPPGWAPDVATAAVCPPMGPGVVSGPPPVVPAQKSVTPVVSALAPGPPVDLGQYPSLSPQRHGGHQSPARNKRKVQREQEQAGIDSRPQIVERILSPPSAVPHLSGVAQPVEQPVVVEERPAPKALPVQNAPVPPVVHTAPIPPAVVQNIPSPVAAATLPPPLQSVNVSVPVKQEVEPAAPVAAAAPPPVTTAVPPAVTTVVPPAVIPAPVEPAVVTAPSVKSSQSEPPFQDAKSNHRNKSKKHQKQHEHQQAQPRQATPPPPTQTQPPAKKEEAPKPQQQQTVVPEMVPPAAVAEKVQPAPETKQIVVEPVKENVDESQTELTEDSLVAAMNAENTKLSASQETTVPETQLENNNVPDSNRNNVAVIVEPAKEATPVIEYSKPVLKHVYKEDQWSPVNQTGKKKYERDFIMKLMADPQSQKRPANLPDLEALKDGRSAPREHNMRGSLMANRHGIDMMPNFGGKSSSMRSGSSSMKRPSQLSNKPKSNKPQAPIQVSLSLNEEVKLRECATPWKPSRNETSTATTDEELKTETLYKKVRGVLNKLTPEKFEQLVKQVKELPIDNVHRLRGVINLVFEKAVDEPGFSVAYAEMCKSLGEISVVDDEVGLDKDGKPQLANYRKILLARCQQEFEKDTMAELSSETRVKDIENEADPEKKKEMKAIWEEDQRRARVKAVGNVRFVGELFKKGMINGAIMISCIDHLLKLNTEESLECLCKLLTTIGKQLEKDINDRRNAVRAQAKERNINLEQALKNVQNVDGHFGKLQDLVRGKDKKLSNRVRFMIQDLIDLRTHNWVPRRDDAKPKTMDQVVKDAEREQIENNLALNASSYDKRGGGGRQDSRGNMGGKQDNMNNTGWNVVGNPSKREKFNVETDKLRLDQNDADLDAGNISLGGRNQFMWKKADNRNNPQSQQPSQPMGFASVSQNKYALLEEKSMQRSSSLKGNYPSDSRSNNIGYQFSRQEDSRNVRNNSQQGPGMGSRANSREYAPPTPQPTPPQAPSPVPTGTLSVDDCLRISQSVLEEFINILDFEDASKNITEHFKTDADKDALVANILVIGLEKKELSRRGASRLLADSLMTGTLTCSNFLKGLASFLEQAEDLRYDAPKLWEYLAEQTVDVVTDNLGFQPILDALTPASKLLGPEGPQRTVAALLRLIQKERPFAPIIQTAIDPVKTFLGGDEEFQKFIEGHSLQFLKEGEPQEPVAFDSVKAGDEILRLLKRKIAFNQITQWISLNVGQKHVQEPAFIFALTTAVLENSVIRKGDGMNYDPFTLRKHFPLLIRYIDNKENLELHALYALQAKDHQWQHPRAVLQEICTDLSTECVISTESFNNWRKCDDARYAEGKGVCMKSLTGFFIVLNEGDDEDVS